KTLDHQALNQAAAGMYRDRFDNTPGIVYAAGVDHAYNLAKEFRAAGLKAEAVSGRTPPVRLAETLAAYERGEINILINAPPLAAPRPPPPHAGAVARAGHAGRPSPDRRHPARVAADRSEVPRRGRAALLGDDRRAPDPLRRARILRPEAH